MSSTTFPADPHAAPSPVERPCASNRSDRDASDSSSPTCQMIAPSRRSIIAWDKYVLAHPEGTPFHTISWRDAVEHAFGHEALYLTALRGHRLVGVLPVFQINSRFTGRRLVSVPYAVGGGILADDQEAIVTLFDTLKAISGERRCAVIDLRSERSLVPEIPKVNRYVGFRRALPDLAKDVLGWLPRKARAAARNARSKYGVTVAYGDEHLRVVWRLYTISMRRLGSLAYPFRFFQRLVDCMPQKHWVSVAHWNGRPVAGLLTLLHNDRVLPYFTGTTDDARKCSAANLIYLSAMERAVSAGYRVFDFGRSRRANTGSFNFKRFHGFDARPLGYQVYTAPGRRIPDLTPGNPRLRVAQRLWTHLPLVVTRRLGAHLARHLTG